MKSNKKSLLICAGVLAAVLSAGETQAQSGYIQPRQAWWHYHSPYYDALVGYQIGPNNSVQSVQTSPRNIFRVTQIASQSNSATVIQIGSYNSSHIIQHIFGGIPFTASAP
jgi:hypothetical protein